MVSEIVRFEIVIDSVATHALIKKMASFAQVTYTVHRCIASQEHGNIVTEDDLSDALSSNLFLAFVPKEQRESFEKMIKPVLKRYSSSVFVSSCQELQME